MKTWVGILLAAVFVQPALAEENVAPAANASSISAPVPQQKKWTDNLMLGIKSWNDSGRYSDGNGRAFKTKNEYFLGAKSESGWGGYIMGVEQANQYNAANTHRNTFSPQDPSISIMHPIYKSENWSMSGQFKEYFPVGDFSKDRGLYEQTYYLNLNAKLKGGVDLFNQLVPRYFSQTKYLPTDTTFYAEDLTFLSRQATPTFRYGIAQHSQLEFHNATPAGTTIEIFPYCDFMLSRSVFGGPRLYLPVWSQNSVFDAPKGVSTANVQAEVYLQATL